MDRQPVVAGRFYSADPKALRGEVNAYLAAAEAESQPALLAMAPHAGYVFSGKVAGKTIGRVNLADSVLLLGPNHTGKGKRLAVWPDGVWKTPLGDAMVDTDLVESLTAVEPRLQLDTEAHLMEHSLEVMLPFIQQGNPQAKVVAVAVAEPSFAVLQEAASHMAGALKGMTEPVSIVVSSDMSHYISHDEAKTRDSLALKAIEELDPAGLYETVRANNISMCGVLPMTLGLLMAVELGAQKAEVVTYATSGEVSGDYEQVVGYAGVVVG